MPKRFAGFYEHVNENTPIVDIINNDAFGGEGVFLMPVIDPDRYDSGMTLKDIAELLLWHTGVDTNETAAGINALIDEINGNEEIFYDYYSSSEKQADPAKALTKLIFMRGKPGAPFVLIVPGGGGYYNAAIHTGFPLARRFTARGYNAFVLVYRLGTGMPGEKEAVDDIRKALSHIRANAAGLRVDPDQYALAGDDAGGAFAGACVYGSELTPRDDSFTKPLGVILAYPILTLGISCAAGDPPLYLISGQQDRLTSWIELQARVKLMEEAKITVIKEMPAEAEHGFGIGRNRPTEGWEERAIAFFTSLLPHPLR